MFKTDQERLVEFMMFKRNLLPEDVKFLYFTNDDAIAILSWNDKKAKKVLDNLKNSLIDYEYFNFDADSCVFCLAYSRDLGYSPNCEYCEYCEYRKNHGRCNSGSQRNTYGLIVYKHDRISKLTFLRNKKKEIKKILFD